MSTASTSRFRFVVLLVAISSLLSPANSRAESPDEKDLRANLPDEPRRFTEIENENYKAFRLDKTVWIVPKAEAIAAKKLQIPRLCAPIRSLQWRGGSTEDLKFVPEPKHWQFSWKGSPADDAMIEIVFDESPILLEQCAPVQPRGDGSIMLHAHQAKTTGQKLRYEPQWYKNTVGYWTVADDFASWELQIGLPGRYTVAILQGCGEGQGGSEAMISVINKDQTIATLPLKTIETGHFQNFRWNHLGEIEIPEAGTFQLRLEAIEIANKALLDARAIHLVRQATP